MSRTTYGSSYISLTKSNEIEEMSITFIPGEASLQGSTLAKVGPSEKLFVLHDVALEQQTNNIHCAVKALGAIQLLCNSKKAAAFGNEASFIDAFKVFADWVHTQKVPPGSSLGTGSTYRVLAHPSNKDVEVYRTYVLGQYLQEPNFKSAILTELFTFLYNMSPNVEVVKYCYK